MPELERLHGLRVVADPAALDAARWRGADVTVLRFAPDDALGLGAEAVEVDDEHAIVEAEAGYVGVWLSLAELEPHLEWPLPVERPALAQGAVAGIPAKVWLPDVGANGAGGEDRRHDGRRDDGRRHEGRRDEGRHDGPVLILTAAAYAAELSGRLR